jgi:hypothetical protein
VVKSRDVEEEQRTGSEMRKKRKRKRMKRKKKTSRLSLIELCVPKLENEVQ